mmetsp:Transcript_1168/g.3323  ORF Transcript_1168/g.3323 Transcript_1168/m.3323 type:complete len:633 (-) Transcript_1168:1060-2958(-)|eukprot:CAMPEP_0181022716 /NCGR_PEP_ID=MMETSP1070-20121207/1660_1 /TAXON_ID=265543 /ORGANISM="Minutocellus polymorphus, Strain NH13" /LENGTH=632 /DNA_ID=CAMNT_0023099671 /DNA_START=27 /DNA_END=1925 /DNA_ORIENTATION=-
MPSEDKPSEAAIKAGKKILKRQDSGGSMKLKSLAKEVATKIDHDCHKEVKKWIKKSDKFDVSECGKHVSLAGSKSGGGGGDAEKKKELKRKRSSLGGGSGSGDDADKSSSSGKKKSKKDKKQKKEKQSSSAPAATAAATSGSTLDSSAVDQWRKEQKIVLMDAHDDENGKAATKVVNANKAYHPYSTFDAPGCVAEIDPILLKQCTQVNKFVKPSPIQAQCWPVLLHNGDDGKRRDIVGIAETGSGKTLAFAMPALTAMHKEDGGSHKKARGRSPRMLVLAPTRELAMQVQQVVEEYGETVSLKSIVIYGGVPKYEQKNELRKGVDCVVATPGRLKDLISENAVDLSNVSQLVLDEADRMLDMGFEEDVRFIIGQTKDKEQRQTAMFSATWPAIIQKIAFEYLVNPIRVYVGFESIVGSNGENSVDDSLSANKRVTQTVEVIEDRARDPRLRELLNKYHSNRTDRILIFALYKKEAERLEYQLKRDGWNCTSIHGNKAQDARTRALEEFKSGKCPLMVATDVAARGLDIPNVEMVLNFTFPLTIEDYVHRIGRTGRAGKTGVSHTFFQTGDKSHAGELQQVMKQAGQPVPEELMKFGSTIKKKEHKLYGNFGPKGGPMKKATKITFGDSDDE